MINRLLNWIFCRPKPPQRGQIYYSTDNTYFYRYDGKSWVKQDSDYATKASLEYGDDQY